MRVLIGRMRSFCLLPSLLLIQLANTGCSGSNAVDMGGEEGSKVASVVEDLNEVKHNSKKLPEVFVDSKKAPDVKRLNKLAFYVAGKPTVNGTSATCKVLVEKLDGTPLGEKEWSFEKISDSWKIKSAPTSE